MFKIYGYATQNSKKVLYVAEELGIDYEFEKVDLRKGESRTEDFAKKISCERFLFCNMMSAFFLNLALFVAT